MTSSSVLSLLLVIVGIAGVWSAQLGTGVGCRQENIKNRQYPTMLFHDRSGGGSLSSGYLIRWNMFSSYLVHLRLRCVYEGRRLGFKFVALQNWGECWAGNKPPAAEANSNKCKNGLYKPCPHNSWATCVGGSSTNYIYCVDDCSLYEK